MFLLIGYQEKAEIVFYGNSKCAPYEHGVKLKFKR